MCHFDLEIIYLYFLNVMGKKILYQLFVDGLEYDLYLGEFFCEKKWYVVLRKKFRP